MATPRKPEAKGAAAPDTRRDGALRNISPDERHTSDDDPVPRNEFGGVLVHEEELRAAFDFFDINKRGVITAADLKNRLGVFYKNLPAREYKFLINEPDFTYQSLHKLLMNNELRDFDPVKEAFKVYDPHETGYVDMETLKTIFVNLGFGDLTSDDIQVLVETADVDGDGKISLNDFRKMVGSSKQKELDLDALHATVKAGPGPTGGKPAQGSKR